MNYAEAIEYIYSRRKFQKSSGHERMLRLLELLGNVQEKLKFIHVAGTNGKGSVSTALSYCLKEAGYKTGLFVSPFVVEFGERIQVNNRYIPKNEVAEITSFIKESVEIMESEELYPTVFEVTTALALCYFAKEKCDIVVLEAGIGGEHDSTNVIKNTVLSVFTHISLDHTEMLGDTVEKIAKEKSGIIKKGSQVVSFPGGDTLGFLGQENKAVEILKAKSESLSCTFHSPSAENTTVLSDSILGVEFVYEGLRVKSPLCGRHQIGNMMTVVCCLKVLQSSGYKISDSDIENGISKATLPARMETVSKKPLVILDGGHNEDCILALKRSVSDYLKGKNVIFLMAFMKDKDYASSIKHIAPVCSKFVFTNVDKLRGEAPLVLKSIAKGCCDDIECEENAAFAFERIVKTMSENDALVVAGSFYLSSEIRNKFFS